MSFVKLFSLLACHDTTISFLLAFFIGHSTNEGTEATINVENFFSMCRFPTASNNKLNFEWKNSIYSKFNSTTQVSSFRFRSKCRLNKLSDESESSPRVHGMNQCEEKIQFIYVMQRATAKLHSSRQHLSVVPEQIR